MLGIGSHHQPWRWHAVGKHPAAADYIHLRGGPPLLNALADWMAKGYEAIQSEAEPVRGTCSWRFWLRGTQKGRLICGLGRDSSDRIGRPYPLLLTGEGPLPKWERQWPLLPALLATTWERMERIAAQRYESLQDLADAVAHLEPPRHQSSAIPAPAADAIAPDRLEACRAELGQTGRVTIALNESGGGDPAASALTWHALLQGCCPDIPRAVFLGGNTHRTYMVVLRQPLSTADFVRLWCVA